MINVKDIDKPSYPRVIPILVEFKLTDVIWKVVVEEAREIEKVGTPTKGEEVFYIAYPDRESWQYACVRFGHQVEHKVVNREFSYA